jgi:MutS domain V
MTPDPAAVYHRRIERFTSDREAEAARSLRFGTARVVTFVLLLGAGVWSEIRPGNMPLAAATVLGGLFIGLVIGHGRVRARIRRLDVLIELNREGTNRLARAWHELPARPAPAGLADPAMASDLDLYGRPALAQLFGPTGTPAGERILGRFLTEPPLAAELGDRQAAVRELAGRLDLRDDLAAATRLEPIPREAVVERFLAWADRAANPEPGWLRLARFAVPAATMATAGLTMAGMAPISAMALPLLAAGILTMCGPGRTARSRLTQAVGREDVFKAYPTLFERVANETYSAGLLSRLRDRLGSGPGGATREMISLARIAHLAGLRSSGMLYVPVQLVTLWDFHVVPRAEAWRAKNGPHVREWLEALGSIEALAALSAMAHDHPAWVQAELDDSLIFDAEELGHPMIPSDRRVDNDVRVGPPGTFLLITGSNMSGKSTLLRAIGQNAILGLSGAPACARRLRLPRLRIETNIHVEDSLADGVSYFMAQLRRVKAIVDAARAGAAGDTTILYLLDEILQGTNSAERRIAASRVIRHLLDCGAIGAVTTHDLGLAEDPALLSACVPVHFRETVHPGRETALEFDYRLRPGVATSTNALRLMKIVGLDEEDIPARQ